MERLDDELGLGVTSYLTSFDTTKRRACSRAHARQFQRNVPPNTTTTLFFEVRDDLPWGHDFFVVHATANPYSPLRCWQLTMRYADILVQWRRFRTHGQKLFDMHDFVLALAHAGGRLHHCSSRLCRDPEIVAAAKAASSAIPLRLSNIFRSLVKCSVWGMLGGHIVQLWLHEDDSITRLSLKVAAVFCCVAVPFLQPPIASEENMVTAFILCLFLVGLPVVDYILE